MTRERELVEDLQVAQLAQSQLVYNLENLKASMVDLSQSVKVAKAIGTTAGAVGTVAALGGLALAFFTAETSLFLTTTAIGGGVIGGATNVTTSIVEHKKYKKYMQCIEKVVKMCGRTKRGDTCQRVRNIFENYCRDVCKVAKDCGFDEDSFPHAVKKAATTGIQVVTFSATTLKNIELLRKATTISTLLKYGWITGPMNPSGAGFGFQAASAEAYTALLASEPNAMKAVAEYGTSLSTSSKSTTTLVLGAAFSVVQVGFTAYEIASLVKSWSTKHPAAEAVEDLISKIKADMSMLDELIKSLEKAAAPSTLLKQESCQERDAMGNEKELMEGLRRARTVKQDFVAELKNHKRVMVQNHAMVEGSKSSVITVGKLGIVTTFAGVVMAPFTGGLSLVLPGSVISFGVVGGVFNVGDRIVEHIMYKDSMNRIEKLVKKYAEEVSNLCQIVESYVSQAAKNADLDVNTYLNGAKEIGSTGVREFSSATGTINGVQAARQAATVSKLLKYGTLTGSITKTSTGIGFQAASLQALTALMANEANATEIFDLVRSWNKQHPTIEAVDDIIRKMQTDIETLDYFIVSLDS